MLTYNDSFTNPLLYIVIAVWFVTGFASAFWFMRVVFRRYETTLALPVEYGTLNAASVLTGLLFYQEHTYMSNWQLAAVIVGSAIILGGIYVGRAPMPPEECKVMHST